MASRKWRSHRRRHYSTRLVDVRTRLTRFARSDGSPAAAAETLDSQPFHGLTFDQEIAAALGESIAERLPDVDELLAGEIVE